MSRSSRARGLKPFQGALKIRRLGSRSSRARGLKHHLPRNSNLGWLSRSSRARGLKPSPLPFQSKHRQVALFTSAWIETLLSPREWVVVIVALFTSAWIETGVMNVISKCNASRSSRARGLKPTVAAISQKPHRVALFTSAWIETVTVPHCATTEAVALFTSAWIETSTGGVGSLSVVGRALHERVD